MHIAFDISQIVTLARAMGTAKERTLKLWEKTLFRHLEKAVTKIKREYRSGPRSDTVLGVVTGNLKNSYSQETIRDARGVSGAIGLRRATAKGKALVYGPVHEKEGETIIRSKRKGGKLAIPIAKQFRKDKIVPPPLTFQNTFIRLSKRGSLLIFQRQGARAVPLFLLVDSVKIKGRPAIKPVMTPLINVIGAKMIENAAAAIAA